MLQVPSSLLLEKFYTYVGNPVYNKYTGTYNGSCPVCREGKSWLKKKRLFYYPETSTFYCFNCSKSWNSYTWLYEAAGMTKDEIQNYSYESEFHIKEVSLKEIEEKTKIRLILPHDSINLMDEQQVLFYKNNAYIEKALKYIKERKLDIAVNKSSAYYISFTDYVHKNRLCIPYYEGNKIVFFQTRSLDGSEPRYLNKIGAEKSVFGVERIDPKLDYIFIFEGPMDASMVRNGVAVAGIKLTDYQKNQLNKFPFHKKIWITDNPRIDATSKTNTIKLLEDGNSVFNWKDIKYKDFNEWCIEENLNEISTERILSSVY